MEENAGTEGKKTMRFWPAENQSFRIKMGVRERFLDACRSFCEEAKGVSSAMLCVPVLYNNYSPKEVKTELLYILLKGDNLNPRVSSTIKVQCSQHFHRRLSIQAAQLETVASKSTATHSLMKLVESL